MTAANNGFSPDNIFEFNYRARYRVTTDHIVAKDLVDARNKAVSYCDRFDLRFISVRPFLLDLNKRPRDKTTVEQEPADEPASSPAKGK